jgi:hypothetical protein
VKKKECFQFFSFHGCTLCAATIRSGSVLLSGGVLPLLTGAASHLPPPSRERLVHTREYLARFRKY